MRRSEAELLALASDPVAGWDQLPLVRMLPATQVEALNAPYLAAFLKHHRLPASYEAMSNLNGGRLWDMTKLFLEAGTYEASKVFPQGIDALAKAFNHGFEAPVEAQEKLVQFLQSRPGDAYAAAARQLQQHYQLCRSFRRPREEMSDPPSYLDLFKNEEVQKVWSCEEGIERVLVNSHGVLCSWPALMSDTWDASNAARDAATHWNSCQADVDALHAHLAHLSNEGQKVSNISYFSIFI